MRSCPEPSPASAITVGSPTVIAESCCRSAAASSTNYCRQLLHRCPASLLPGHALTATAPCAWSSGLPLPRSPSPKPDWHVRMTPLERPLNPTHCACLSPCSLNVCPVPRNGRVTIEVTNTLCPDRMQDAHSPHSGVRRLPRFSPAPPAINGLKTHSPEHPPPPHHRLPSYGSIRTAPRTGRASSNDVGMERFR